MNKIWNSGQIYFAIQGKYILQFDTNTWPERRRNEKMFRSNYQVEPKAGDQQLVLLVLKNFSFDKIR